MPSTSLIPGAWARIDLADRGSLRLQTVVHEQAIELVAHRAGDPAVRLSTLVTALAENVYQPRPDTRFWSQEYTPLFHLTSLTNDENDMMLEACNPDLNRSMFPGRTGSCWANFREGLAGIGLGEKWIPYPLGVFRRAGESAGRFALLPAASRPGDEVSIVADAPIVVFASACPVSSPPEAAGRAVVELEWRNP